MRETEVLQAKQNWPAAHKVRLSKVCCQALNLLG